MATKENFEWTEEEMAKTYGTGTRGIFFSIFKDILRKPSPPTETLNYNSILRSTHSEPTNYNNRSYSSGYSGGYHSSVGNLNGSSGFSQGGGGHSNFFATVKRL